MKVHTTNYQNTFITTADDCPVKVGEIPPVKGDAKSVAAIQFDIISKNPYRFTSDEVLFQVYAERNDISSEERERAREQFFLKGQPCLRASPLTKRYGWGIHCNQDGKIALYACNSKEYNKFSEDATVKVVKAMKSSR